MEVDLKQSDKTRWQYYFFCSPEPLRLFPTNLTKMFSE